MSDTIQELMEEKIRAILAAGEKVPLRLDAEIPNGGLYFEEILMGAQAAKRFYSSYKGDAQAVIPGFSVVCHPDLWAALGEEHKAMFKVESGPTTPPSAG